MGEDAFKEGKGKYFGKRGPAPGTDNGAQEDHSKDTDQPRRDAPERGGRRVPDRGGADDQGEKAKPREPEAEEELNFED